LSPKVDLKSASALNVPDVYAIRQYEFGAPTVLRFERMPDPAPGDGQVRVDVRAAGVHLIDTMIRRGATGGPFALPALPMTPGREVAGAVDAVGAGVEPDWLGRRVVVHLGQASGGYAEFALASADRLHTIPDGMPAEMAVAMIGTGRTAVGVLHSAALTAGDVVIVTAAAGGLGSLFVQEATALGATVVALAGNARKVAQARSLGAGIAVDYQDPDWAAEVRAALGDRTATVAFDGVGGPVGRAVFELLGSGGRLARFGWSSGAPAHIDAEEFVARGVTDVPLRIPQRPDGLRQLESVALDKAASGAWQVRTEAFGLARASAAHEALEGRATMGKVVLVR
jgi:NADPH:quinone reductase